MFNQPISLYDARNAHDEAYMRKLIQFGLRKCLTALAINIIYSTHENSAQSPRKTHDLFIDQNPVYAYRYM